MDRAINIILVTCSIIAGFIGFFFVLKIWLAWKHIDMSVLKARVFLDPEFLIRNWIIIFITGAFIVFRRIIQLSDLLNYQIVGPGMSIIFDLAGFAVVVLLVILAFYWHELLISAVDRRKNIQGK